jgi:SAM-dependent methyltransferase
VDGACPACGAAALRHWRQATAPDGGRTFALQRCTRCGTARLAHADPAPPELYTSGSYAPTRAGARLVAAPLEALSHRLRLRLLAPLPAGARVLDVGAGDGSFVAALRRRGLDAHGIDPTATGGAVSALAAEELELEPASLDAAVLWHTLEHLEEPESVLRRIEPALRQDGKLLVGVPDLGSLQAQIGGDRWFHQDVPRHRTHFTRAGVEALLGRVGLRVAEASQLVPEQNLLGMWQTLLNRCTTERDVAFRLAKGERRGSRRDLAATAVLGPVLAAPAVALELAAAAAGRAGTMAVVAVRVA